MQNLTVNFNYLETPEKRKCSKAPFYELAFWVSQNRAAFSKPAVVSSLTYDEKRFGKRQRLLTAKRNLNWNRIMQNKR